MNFEDFLHLRPLTKPVCSSRSRKFQHNRSPRSSAWCPGFFPLELGFEFRQAFTHFYHHWIHESKKCLLFRDLYSSFCILLFLFYCRSHPHIPKSWHDTKKIQNVKFVLQCFLTGGARTPITARCYFWETGRHF